MVLAVLAAVCLAVGVVRLSVGVLGVFDPRMIQDTESIVYAQTTRIVHGAPLYQSLAGPPYTVVAYMPLYYELAAGVHALVGPGFISGRAVSLVSGLAAIAILARIAVRATGDRRAGILAPALFLTFGFPHFPWFAQFRVDMLGITLSLAVILVLSEGASRRRLVFAGVLAALALLTKQTQVAAVMAVTIWLVQHDWRRALVFLGPCVAIVLAVVLAFELTTHAFIDNTVTANVVPFAWVAVDTALPTFVRFQAFSVVIAGAFVLRSLQAKVASHISLLVWYWLATFLPVVALAKVGSYDNYWIELAAVSAVLVTMALWRAFGPETTVVHQRLGIVASVLLIVNTGAVVSDYIPGLITRGTAVLRPHALTSAETTVAPSLTVSSIDFSALVQRVRSEPLEVLASPMDVVALADRQVLLEGYIFNILYAQQRWDTRPLDRRICAGQVGLLVVDKPLESSLNDDVAGYHGYGFFAAPILAVLRERMVLETESAGRLLYVPRAAPTRTATQACENNT